MIRNLDSSNLNQLYIGHVDDSPTVLVGIVSDLHMDLILNVDTRNYGFSYWYCNSDDTNWEPLI